MLLELVHSSHPKGTLEKQRAHCDLIAANLIHYRGEALRYSRRNGRPMNDRYMIRDYSGYMVTVVVDCLNSEGYLKTTIGSYDTKTGVGEASTITPTNKLLSLLGKDKYWIIREKVELIRLKNHKGVLTDYKDTDKTQLMRQTLEKINDLIGSVKIGGVADIDPTKSYLYRVFNGDFRSGGRFYGGWWESCRSDQRQWIKINGERTVEVDYPSHHLRILYAREGIKPPAGDLYLLDAQDESERPLMKMINLIALCSRNYHQAVGAIEKKAVELGFRGRDIPVLLKAFMEKHHQIRHHYCTSGVGISLQYTDSCIAESVLLGLAEEQIVCLPVHDSFIVQQRHKEYLRKEMRLACMAFGVDLEDTDLEERTFPEVTGSFSRGNDDFSRGNSLPFPQMVSSSLPVFFPSFLLFPFF